MPDGVGFVFLFGGDKLSYEFKSKIVGVITKEIAEKWGHPELAGKIIYQFAKIDKHIEKHFSQFKLGEKSKNYTMRHLKEVLLEPDYVCYNVKNEGFEYHKKLLEYIVVTVKPAHDNPDVFCVSTIYPSSKQKLENRKRKEQESINKILLEKYKYKEKINQ